MDIRYKVPNSTWWIHGCSLYWVNHTVRKSLISRSPICCLESSMTHKSFNMKMVCLHKWLLAYTRVNDYIAKLDKQILANQLRFDRPWPKPPNWHISALSCQTALTIPLKLGRHGRLVCVHAKSWSGRSLYVSMRTGASYHKLACSVLGTFWSDYLYMHKLPYVLQLFWERHGQFEFLLVIILIKPQNICSLITLASTGKPE